MVRVEEGLKAMWPCLPLGLESKVASDWRMREAWEQHGLFSPEVKRKKEEGWRRNGLWALMTDG